MSKKEKWELFKSLLDEDPRKHRIHMSSTGGILTYTLYCLGEKIDTIQMTFPEWSEISGEYRDLEVDSQDYLDTVQFK